MDESKGFLGTLFDFSFSEFVTTKVIKVLFVIGIVLAAIGAITFIAGGFGRSWFLGVLALLISPLIFLIYTLLFRVYLEIIIVIFRIAENVQKIAGGKESGGDELSGTVVGSDPDV